MATNNHKKRFGLSTSVENHMAIFESFGQERQRRHQPILKNHATGMSAKKTMLFHTLAMLDPAFEAKYPGVQACVHVAHGMFNDTKEKKQFIRKWFMALNGPQKDVLTLDLPKLGGPD